MAGFDFIVSEREITIGSFRVGRLLDRNFVSSHKVRLQQAKEDCIASVFPAFPEKLNLFPTLESAKLFPAFHIQEIPLRQMADRNDKHVVV